MLSSEIQSAIAYPSGSMKISIRVKVSSEPELKLNY